jgi:hypothetical protein
VGGEQACLNATFECGPNDGEVMCESGGQSIDVNPDPSSVCACEVDPTC